MSPRHFETDSDLFIEKMKKTGAIDQAVFSMSIGMGDSQSKITFGGYDLERFAKKNSTINWHDITPNSHYWEIGLQQTEFTTQISDEKISYGFRRAIVDSGTSYTLLPKQDHDKLLDSLEAAHGFQFERQQFKSITTCTSDQYQLFPDMHMLIDGKEYVQPRDSYVEYQNG